MGYSNKNTRKPFEPASKSSHRHVINDPEVHSFLGTLDFPIRSAELSTEGMTVVFEQEKKSPISHIIAIDGGSTEIEVRQGFPSSSITIFQFGALLLSLFEMKKLNNLNHISPDDMARLNNNIDRFKLVLPTKGVRISGMKSFQESVRVTIYNFFSKKTLPSGHNLLDVLKWFVFRQYKGKDREANDCFWELSSNPLTRQEGQSIILREGDMLPDGTFKCPFTGGKLYLTDIFRLHELISEETGATGICGHLTGVIEHIIAIDFIRQLLIINPEALSEVLFIMDRPTGFFGQTARLHVLMGELINWLFDRHQIYWAGLEKSGAFVDHANEIRDLMPASSILLLNDQYIYKYISPGEEQLTRAYADTSYYGHKVIFKTTKGNIYVVSVPVRNLKKSPKLEDLPNLQTILTHIEELHCDMYDSAIIPIALVNKLVSLSDGPSKQILKSFVKSSII